MKVLLIGGPREIEGQVREVSAGSALEVAEPRRMAVALYDPVEEGTMPVPFDRHLYRFIEVPGGHVLAVHSDLSLADAVGRLVRVFEKTSEGFRG